jgi:hypothetical protein
MIADKHPMSHAFAMLCSMFALRGVCWPHDTSLKLQQQSNNRQNLTFFFAFA